MNLLLRSASLLTLASLAFAARAQNLVVNPGFETGDFTGWTFEGDASGAIVDGLHPHSGGFGASFGPQGAGGIRQDVATVPGATYLVSLWFQSRPGGHNSTSIGFGPYFLLSTDDEPASAYRLLTGSFTAYGASTELFVFSANERGAFDVDDVSVTLQAVPEPSALAALGLGAVAILRRRKRA